MSKSKAEKEREKIVTERCQILLNAVLKDEDNKYCVDCDAKGPRWASWNIGVLLCIRCAGIHRNLGVHISKVRSVNLDSWTPNQVASMQCMGNSRARAIYEANLPDDFRRPTSDSQLEAFIRNKYEKKKYIAKEWVPTKPPDLPVGWAELIEAEKLGKAKDPKFIASLSNISNNNYVKSEMKPAPSKSQATATAAAPRTVTATKSPAAAAVTTATTKSAAPLVNTDNQDLLGLSVSAPAPVASPAITSKNVLDDDLFSNFVSASSAAESADHLSAPSCDSSNQTKPTATEDDFFNQASPGNIAGTTIDPSKMSNSSIMALFSSGSSSSTSTVNSQGVGQIVHQQFGGLPQQLAGQFQSPLPGQQQHQAFGLGHAQPLPGQPRPGLPTTPHQAFAAGVGQSQFQQFAGQPAAAVGVSNQPFNGFQQQQQQMFGQSPQLQQFGQQQLLMNNNQANSQVNPFADLGMPSASPKMINSLPQNVFQMNNQLAGLQLQGGSTPTFPQQNGPSQAYKTGTSANAASPFQNGGTGSMFGGGVGAPAAPPPGGLAPSLWQ